MDGDHAMQRHGRRQGRARQGPCPLCHRMTGLTFHHLIPRKLHRRPRFRRLYDRLELQRGIYICRDCHAAVHRRFTEMELGSQYNTLAALRDDPELARHFAWVSKRRIRS